MENELGLSEQQVEDVAEIFQTPLTGALQLTTQLR